MDCFSGLVRVDLRRGKQLSCPSVGRAAGDELLEQWLGRGVILFFQVSESKVQEKAGIAGRELQGTAVHVDRITRSPHAGIDHAKVAERSDVIGLGFKNRAKALLGCRKIAAGKCGCGAVEGGL